MRAAAQCLIGEHDFTSFRASQCQARRPVRTIELLHIARRGELLVIEVKANAFLHHMVRNIVGVLLAVGAGEAAPEWMAQFLAARGRSAGGVTARAFGTCLLSVDSPATFRLPLVEPGPLFISEHVGALESP